MSDNPGVLPPLQRFNTLSEEAVYHSIRKKNVDEVSAVIITYNEEAIISTTLSKLSWCDEIIIIDSGSTDKTVEICEEYGCSIYYRPFKGFGEQKRFGV